MTKRIKFMFLRILIRLGMHGKRHVVAEEKRIQKLHDMGLGA